LLLDVSRGGGLVLGRLAMQARGFRLLTRGELCGLVRDGLACGADGLGLVGEHALLATSCTRDLVA
jgi:hypothetical protein